MILLIDGDIPIYKCAWAAQADKKLLPLGRAELYLDRMIESYISFCKKRFNINKVVIFLTSTDKSNFRYGIAETAPYKGERTERPLYYHALRHRLIKKWQGLVVEGREADDAISIYVALNPGDCVVASGDKDLRQIDDDVWIWNGDYTSKPFYVARGSLGTLYLVRGNSGQTQPFGTGLKWFYCQLLTGDKQCDNIHGIKGFGPVSSVTLLQNCTSVSQMFKYVLAVYLHQKLDTCRIVENGRLLWMQKHPDDLWEPPGGLPILINPLVLQDLQSVKKKELIPQILTGRFDGILDNFKVPVI